MKDTLFVPQFHFSLLSVSALTNTSHFIVHFYHDHFEIQETSTWKMIGNGDKVGGLYILHKDIAPIVNKVYAQILNNRFGHPSFKFLEILRTQIHCDNIHHVHQDPVISVHLLNNVYYLLLLIIIFL